jgi:hypothetical protein
MARYEVQILSHQVWKQVFVVEAESEFEARENWGEGDFQYDVWDSTLDDFEIESVEKIQD